MTEAASPRLLWFWKRAEVVLLAVGMVCACCLTVTSVAGFVAARQARQYGASGQISYGQSDDRGSGLGMVNVTAPSRATESAAVMGKLEIPAIGLSVPILSDYGSASLLKGVGHIPGTALPGGLGTLGLAGHRDTYFRPLQKIKTNMEIRVGGRDGIYRYLVDSTEIVKPEAVQVLDIRSRPELSLITCYPFYYVGAAPLRFIVHAHLVSAIPDIPR